MSDALWAYVAQVNKEPTNFLLRRRILDLFSIEFLCIYFDYELL